jgi:hypothetical protein
LTRKKIHYDGVKETLMTILETIIFTIQSTYIDVKYWVRRKLGIKELTDDPIKAKWTQERLKKHPSFDASKVLSDEQIDDILKDLYK